MMHVPQYLVALKDGLPVPYSVFPEFFCETDPPQQMASLTQLTKPGHF
jgi:hypothetical protein